MGDEREFERFFHAQFRPLVAHAIKFVRDPEEAQEIVQDVCPIVGQERRNSSGNKSVGLPIHFGQESLLQLEQAPRGSKQIPRLRKAQQQ